MDMRRLPSLMTPKADVYLVGLGKRPYSLGYALNKRAKFLSFCCGQVADMDAVAKRFDDQGSHLQRPRAVLDNPMFRCVNPPAGERFDAFGKLARITIRRYIYSFRSSASIARRTAGV
jgi:hypothetical protein